MTSGVNIIKLHISILRALYQFLRKTENQAFYLRNLEYKKTEKKYENTEKNMKLQRKCL